MCVKCQVIFRTWDHAIHGNHVMCLSESRCFLLFGSGSWTPGQQDSYVYTCTFMGSRHPVEATLLRCVLQCWIETVRSMHVMGSVIMSQCSYRATSSPFPSSDLPSTPIHGFSSATTHPTPPGPVVRSSTSVTPASRRSPRPRVDGPALGGAIALLGRVRETEMESREGRGARAYEVSSTPKLTRTGNAFGFWVWVWPNCPSSRGVFLRKSPYHES